jgi:hypothetical protein
MEMKIPDYQPFLARKRELLTVKDEKIEVWF